MCAQIIFNSDSLWEIGRDDWLIDSHIHAGRYHTVYVGAGIGSSEKNVSKNKDSEFEGKLIYGFIQWLIDSIDFYSSFFASFYLCRGIQDWTKHIYHKNILRSYVRKRLENPWALPLLLLKRLSRQKFSLAQNWTEDGRHRQRDNKQKHFGDYGLASSRTVRIDFANHGELSSKYTSL